MDEKHQIVKTNDGSDTLVSSIYGDKYHSKHGSLQESLHVFIEAGLKQKLHLETIHILEMGLGTGLNAWLTCLENEKYKKNIQYVGYEKHPIHLDIISNLNYLEVREDTHSYFQKIHESPWNKSIVISESFQLIKKDTDILFLEEKNIFDIIYFDAFAPDTQPELWSIELFEKLFQSMSTDGCLVTYCAKGQVKRNLKSAGFQIESIPGPIGKREMTRAWKNK